MFQFLPYTNALSNGSALWITQTPHYSPLAQKINWHLHFVFEKSKTSLDDSLLTESSLHLPNNQTLFIPFKKEKKLDWIKKAFLSWQNLEKPSLRLFLPFSLSKQNLIDHWLYEDLPYKIQIIFESI